MIELVRGKDGGMETADGTPVFGESFVFNEQQGKAVLGGGGFSFTGYSGSGTADLRNTVLDFRKLPQPREGMTLAEVHMGAGVKVGVYLRTGKVDSVYFDQDHVVFPAQSRKIEAEGPFLDMEFKLKRSRKSPDDVNVEVLDGDRLLATASHQPDGTYLAKVKLVRGIVLRIRAKDRTAATQYEATIAVPIRGAVPDLIEYFGIEVDL